MQDLRGETTVSVLNAWSNRRLVCSLHTTSQGAAKQYEDVLEVEETRARRSWWRRNRFCCFNVLFILLALAAAALGLYFGLFKDKEDKASSSSSAPGVGASDAFPSSVPVPDAGPGSSSGTYEDESFESSADGSEVGGSSVGGAIVDRTCAYKKSQTVYVSVGSNGVDNG